jgi:hypothetical protein
MKRKTVLFTVLCLSLVGYAQAQSHEAQQLLLNYEKLKALEEILDNMYKGYKILDNGYTTIRNIVQGNYSLHQIFLDGLFAVNPSIRNYKRIPYVISYQQALVKEYKRAYDRFRRNPHFTVDELKYIQGVYEYLLSSSLRNIEELTMIITASKLRMSDDERMQAIDRIYFSMEAKLSFLRYFNSSTHALSVHRAKEHHDVATLEKLHGIEP